MTPSSDDRSELKQRQQKLIRQLADVLISEDSPVREASTFKQDWQQHQAHRERQQSLALLDSKLLAVLPGIEQRERQVAEAKKAVAQEVKTLRQFAAELGKTAFAAVLAGDVAATPRFEARKTLHDHLEKLSHEKDALGQVDASKLTEKVKLKAQQLKMAGEIKMGQLKLGSLDRALGESLLNENEEASVDCPQTTQVLQAITGQRAAIASTAKTQNDALSQLTGTLDKAARTLDRESVEGATVLQAELKQVRKEARSIEKSIVTAREAILSKALEDDTLRDNELLGPNLKQLWSTQFDLKASQSQVSKTADKLTSRLSTLSQPVKYIICGATGCLLLIVLVVWFGKGDGGGDGTSLSDKNEATRGAHQAPANQATSHNNVSEATSETEQEAITALKTTGVTITTRADGTALSLSDFGDPTKNLNDADMVHLRQLRSLVILHLKHSRLTDDGLVNLTGLEHLRSLILTCERITDAGMEHVEHLSELRTVTLTNCSSITEAGIVHLGKLTNLQSLVISYGGQVGSGLIHLKSLTKLEELMLIATGVSDTGLVHLKNMRGLKTLSLIGNYHIKNVGLVHLKGLNKLEHLDLSGTGVTDAGLLHLKGLKKLKFLGLIGTGVTNAGVANLQKALPHCELDHESTDDAEDPIAVVTHKKKGLHFVQTYRMGIANGLFVTIAFVIPDKTHPLAKKPGLTGDRVAGVVLVENVKVIVNLHLSKQTTVGFAPGALPPFGVGIARKCEDDEFATTLEYTDYIPINLLFYLIGKGDGKGGHALTVIIGGKRYPLDLTWRTHIQATCIEALELKERLLGKNRFN